MLSTDPTTRFRVAVVGNGVIGAAVARQPAEDQRGF